MSQAKQLVIDCERLKHPHTGLYHFCLHLGRALAATDRDGRLCFYAPPAAGKVFGAAACYRPQRWWHKRVFPSVRHAALWHCTHQSSDYFPFGRRVKKVLTVHDLNYLHDESKTEDKRRRFRDGLQRKVDESDFVAFVSHYAHRDAAAHLRLQGKATAVVYNGCTIRPLPTVQAPAFVPAQPFLFALGTVAPKKNFHVLPPLLQGNDWRLLIAGVPQSPSYKERILAEAKRFGVQDRVVFVGPVAENDKQWYLQRCTAFVFPSLAEGFGLPVLEAMYFGKPVLLSNATSLPEIGGAEAHYFNGFEPEAMREALHDCLQDFETHPGKSAALKKRAVSFSWEAAAAGYRRIYDEVLRRES